MMRKSLASLALIALGAAVTMTGVRAGQTPTPAEPKPTTYALIDRALEAKRIDEETAHKYRVFAAFGDERLPRDYRGAFEQGDRSIEIDRAGARLATFSAETRAALAPYFLRPDEPGSWVALSGANDSSSSRGRSSWRAAARVVRVRAAASAACSDHLAQVPGGRRKGDGLGAGSLSWRRGQGGSRRPRHGR